MANNQNKPGEMCQSSPDAFCGTKTGAEIVELGKYRLNAHIFSIQGIRRFNSALHQAPQVVRRANQSVALFFCPLSTLSVTRVPFPATSKSERKPPVLSRWLPIVLCGWFDFPHFPYLVPKILSPASPNPGTM